VNEFCIPFCPNAVQEGQCGREVLCHRPFRRAAGSQACSTTLIDSSNGEFASAAEETAQIIGGIEKMWILAGRSRIEGSSPWCHQCQSRDSPTISPHHVPDFESGAEFSRYNLAERRRTMTTIQTQDVSAFCTQPTLTDAQFCLIFQSLLKQSSQLFSFLVDFFAQVGCQHQHSPLGQCALDQIVNALLGEAEWLQSSRLVP